MEQAFQNIENLSASDISNGAFTREGSDLVIETASGANIVVAQYFENLDPPTLLSHDGSALTANMVDAFLGHQAVHAQSHNTMSDIGPIAEATDVFGDAFITRADGTKITATAGTPIFQGDVIETIGDSAMSITFADDTTFAISEGAKLSVDEYVFNQAENSGSSFFSMLKGSFVYTSGLIGKDNPDSVNIDTPAGSIGIRGTVVMGRITENGEGSEIVIVDGAIIVSNAGGTMELNTHLEAVQINGYQVPPVNMGSYSSQDIATSYQSLGHVAGETFKQMNIQPDSSNDETEKESKNDAAQGETRDVEAAEAEAESDKADRAPKNMKEKGPNAENAERKEAAAEEQEAETETEAEAEAPTEPVTVQADALSTIVTTSEVIIIPTGQDATPDASNDSVTAASTGQTTTTAHHFKVKNITQVNSIREFAEVGTFAADIDVNRKNVTFSITDGNIANLAQRSDGLTGTPDMFSSTSNVFSIDPVTGIIRVANPEAFYNDLNNQFTIEVTVVDNASGKQFSHDVTFNVSDLMQGPVIPGQYVVGTTGNDTMPFNPAIADPTVGRDVIWGMSGNDKFITTNGSDILFGGTGSDTFSLQNPDFRHVNGDDINNTDTDTVIFTNNSASDATYDLTGAAQSIERFNDIDVFQIAGTSLYGTTLILDENAILDMTDGDGTLNITGSAYVETIDASSIGLTDQGSGVYTNGSVTLIVDASVDTVTI